MNVVVINFRPFLPVARGVSIHVTASIAFSVASISHGFQKLSRMIYGIALSQPTSFYFEYPSFCFHRFMPNKSPEPTAVGAGSSATRFTSRVGGGSAFFVRPLMIDTVRIRPSHLRCYGAAVHATSRGRVLPTLFRNQDRPILLQVRCFWRATRRRHLSPLLPVVRFLFA